HHSTVRQRWTELVKLYSRIRTLLAIITWGSGLNGYTSSRCKSFLDHDHLLLSFFCRFYTSG
ncbi:unnamed protein product, partial [Musa acuminata subsp. burmannicoides]